MKGLSICVLIFGIIYASLLVDIGAKYVEKKKPENVQIVHGDEVKPHSMPYMAAIHANINDKIVRCGGSLISDSLVLTAAKCVSGAEEAEIILGAHNIDESEDSQVLIISSEFIIHPGYEDDSNLYDIALIQLPTAVQLNENIATVALPELSDIVANYDDELGLVAGWGKVADTDPTPSNVLRAINVTVIPILTCELPYLLSLTMDQMCTTGVEKKNICLGDSGSPLLTDGVQVGIASYGSDFGCEVGLPGVYTRLTSYLSWLYVNIDT